MLNFTFSEANANLNQQFINEEVNSQSKFWDDEDDWFSEARERAAEYWDTQMTDFCYF